MQGNFKNSKISKNKQRLVIAVMKKLSFLFRKYRRYSILLGVYYLYNIFYCGLLASILFYCLTLESVIELIQNLFIEPTFWAGFIAQVFLCNVVISDLLYMTVF